MKEPFVRDDQKGKWRHINWNTPNLKYLTVQSWDTKKQAEEWVNWNNRGEGLYGFIVKNPDLPTNTKDL